MKRLLILFVIAIMAIGAIAQNTLVVKGREIDLHKYKYAYVMPTSGVTSGGLRYDVWFGVTGGPTKTINPAEKISGYLMKIGYTILPSINPDFADKTMVVSYGNTGGATSNYSAVSNIMIQMRDAETQELALSIETEGNGPDESDAITDAIYRAMQMFRYCLDPKVVGEVIEEYTSSVYLNLTNQTPYIVNQVGLKLSYYLNGELVHEQETTVKGSMNPSEEIRVYVKRPKGFRSRKMEIKYKVISYN